MPDDDSPLSVKAEISAKASLAITGQVSTPVVDKLASQLSDAISPFTEWLGIRGDLLRIQRTETAVEALQGALAKLSKLGLYPGTVPARVLVPLLEKASLEDPQSEMLKRWQDLLAASSVDLELQHPIFVELLGRISEREVKFLHSVASKVTDLARIQFDFESAVYSEVSLPLEKHLEAWNHGAVPDPTIGRNEAYRKECNRLFTRFVSEMRSDGCILLVARFSGGDFYHRLDAYQLDVSPAVFASCVDVCTAAGLMRRETYNIPIPIDAIGEFSAFFDVYRMTSNAQLMLQSFRRFSSS